MTAVFDRYPVGGGELTLALALADHAHDDGTHVFPEVSSLARKTRQSVRTVQYQLRKMEESGWLQLVGNAHGGRGRAREYRISEAWIKGADIAPIPGASNGATTAAPFEPEKGCNPRHERVQNGAQKGATAIAPAIEPQEPSLTINPPNPPVGRAQASQNPPGLFAGDAALPPPPPSTQRRGRSELLTLAAWLEQCRQQDVRAIPDTDPVHRTAERMGLPPELVVLAWQAFKRKRLKTAKRQKDWRAVFRNAVEGCWDRLWVADPAGGFKLSTVGIQTKRLIEAEQQDDLGSERAA